MIITEEVAAEVIRLIEEKGYTQRAVADKLGLSRGTVQKWIAQRKGQVYIPKPPPVERRRGATPLDDWNRAMKRVKNEQMG